MSIRESGVLRLGIGAGSLESLKHSPDLWGWNEKLSDYFALECMDSVGIGDILLVPTYRLEEVEEVVEPEKPGVPVEPYVGLMWKNSSGERRVVISVNSTHYEVLQEQLIDSDNRWVRGLLKITDLCWDNYPDTPSTPAVTRKVKKWVKIDHPEAPE